jgi:CheY-like chemotaxis protein
MCRRGSVSYRDEAGCDSHLTKPIRKQTLLRALSESTATADLVAGSGFVAVA